MASICSGSLGNITTSNWKYNGICLCCEHQLNVVAYWDKPHENNGIIAYHSCVKPVGFIWYFGVSNVVISSTFGGLRRHHLMIKYTIFYLHYVWAFICNCRDFDETAQVFCCCNWAGVDMVFMPVAWYGRQVWSFVIGQSVSPLNNREYESCIASTIY